MSKQHHPDRFRLRDFRAPDVPSLVEIINNCYPDEPITLEQAEFWERSYPQNNPRARYSAEWQDGRVVAIGACLRPFWMSTPGAYWIDLMVDSRFRHHGIGQALLNRLERFGWQQGARRLWGNSREDHADASRFLEAAGYHTIGIRFESALDLAAFDERPFAGVFRRVETAGYTLTNLAAERARIADADRKLFDLYVLAMADVPFPGGAHPEAEYDTWRSWMLEAPNVDVAGIFIARQGEDYAGLTALELADNGPAITGTTGILKEHRGQGLATALKLLSFRFLQERGYTEVRAHNDTANPPILQLNRKLGYKRLPGWLSWEKLAHDS